MQELGPEGFCIISFEDVHPRWGRGFSSSKAEVGRFHSPSWRFGEFFHVASSG